MERKRGNGVQASDNEPVKFWKAFFIAMAAVLIGIAGTLLAVSYFDGRDGRKVTKDPSLAMNTAPNAIRVSGNLHYLGVARTEEECPTKAEAEAKFNAYRIANPQRKVEDQTYVKEMRFKNLCFPGIYVYLDELPTLGRGRTAPANAASWPL